MRILILASALLAAAPTAAAADTLVARLHAPGHHPRANKPWRITITARSSSGGPVRAEVRYQYLFHGQVVARRSHYRFRGVFHDTIIWPARSIGIPLTFRAVVTSRIGNRNLDYAVRVRR